MERAWKEVEPFRDPLKSRQDHKSSWSAWTYLVDCADNAASIQEMRDAYDAFVEHWPCCELYWERYASQEQKRTPGSEGKKAALAIYERALKKGLLYSVDLWVHYTRLLTTDAEAQDRDQVLRALTRAQDALGLHYAAHTVWDQFLSWAGINNEWNISARLYERLLSTPLEQLSAYWERYKLFAMEAPLDSLLRDEEERQAFVSQGFNDATADLARHWLLQRREQSYNQTLARNQLYHPMESVVLARPHWSVSGVDATQIHYWEVYLDWQQQAAQSVNTEEESLRTMLLFERALLPCAYESSLWVRYAQWLEEATFATSNPSELSHLGVDRARAVLKRSSEWLPGEPRIFLEWGAFEEQHGCVDEAEEVYNALSTNIPTNIQGAMRHISFLKRHRTYADVLQRFNDCLENIETPSEKAFVWALKVQEEWRGKWPNPEAARSSMEKAVSELPAQKLLWTTWVQLERHAAVVSAEEDILRAVNAVFGRAVHSTPPSDRIQLLQEWMLTLEEMDVDHQLWRKLAIEQHQLVKETEAKKYAFSRLLLISSTGMLKRPYDGTGETQGDAKAARVDSTYNAYYNYNAGQYYGNAPQGYNYPYYGYS